VIFHHVNSYPSITAHRHLLSGPVHTSARQIRNDYRQIPNVALHSSLACNSYYFVQTE